MTETPRRALRLACLALASAFLVAPAASHAASVWTALATEKLYPATAARSQPLAAISSARNEFEAFQIGVTGGATNVSATATALTGPGGATIAAPRLYRVGLINITQASSADGRLGWQPDVLIPDVDEIVGEKRNAFPFDVPAGETRAIWAEVFVPDDATPGTYSGSVKVTMSGGAFDVPVTLTVWPFRLPSTASLKTAFILGYVSLPAGHGVAGASTAMAQLRQRYGSFALDHRITLPRHDDGDQSLTHFEQWYGPLVNGTAETRLKGARLTSVQYQGGTSGYSSWASFFKARGWFDRLFDYTCDEPPITCAWSDIPARAARAKAADPAFRTLVTTNISLANTNGVTNNIDLMVPVVNHMDDRPGWTYAGEQLSKYSSFLAQPRKELWLYQSCMSHGCGGTVAIGDSSMSAQYYTGWPSYMIDASAVRNRAMQWYAYRYRATGELYFETTMAYQHDAWTNQWDFTGNGDGTLFYPGTPAKIGGTTHIPLASIRLKMIREGMEDYEYLKALSAAGDGALADQVAAALFPKPYAAEQNAQDLMSARARIAARLAEITAPAVVVAPGTPDPSPVAGDPVAQPPADAGSGTGAPAPGGTTTNTPPVLADGSTPSGPDMAAMVQAGGCSAPGTTGLAALLGLLAALRRRNRRR
ncbi:MAG TPA: glycoside hydrolase domain-containing protein [Anaeromyxobacteraceae bacterium]|nr:glycoside hydrolase domain-containing protein [Anaeromyxobacteraceae bacterium]